MKKNIIVLVHVLILQTLVFAQNVLTLDTALNNSTSYLRGRIPADSKVLVLNFTSNWPQLSEYIVEELIGYIVNEGTLTVVDRRNLEEIRKEMEFQLSGEVSDETAQSIGKKLGAQTIISGSIVAVGDTYRLRIRAISVETAQIQGMQNVDVRQDSRIGALTGTGYSTPTVSSNNNVQRNSSILIVPNENRIKAQTDDTEGGKSTAKVGLNREVMQGEERMVINMEINLVRGIQYPWGNIQISDSSVVEQAKAASGIRFKAYGDGKRWYLNIATKEATDYAFYRGQINTRRNQIVTINIPYTRLRQPDWGGRRRIGFNKESIYELQFTRDQNDGLGTSSIKIFDIEFY